MEELRSGHFEWVNPFNPRQRKLIPSGPASIDAIVFWSKAPAPCIKDLPELARMGYRLVFQFTLNDYPKLIEPRVPPLDKRLDMFFRLADILVPGTLVWRYDPVLLTNITPPDYHLEHFGRLSRALEGAVRRVIISFVDLYPKVRRKLKTLQKSGIVLGEQEKLSEVAHGLKCIANECHMELQLCSEPALAAELGIQSVGCIDVNLLNELFGLSLTYVKDPGQRPECLCSRSVDIGHYDSCNHGCVYCYANR